jgi:hypothetical protein
MPLPTVLMTDVIRSSQQGDAHGGAYLINLETGDFEKVLDWNRVDIEWEGRGMGRGLRGIVFLGAEVWIAASDELFVFDRSFNILRSYRCPALHHCHEISTDDRGFIWLTSTSYDSILRFDPKAERFGGGWYIAPVTRTVQGRQVTTLASKPYDPNDAAGLPPRQDRLHINQAFWTPEGGGGVLFSGLRFTAACLLDPATGGVRPFAVVPEMTHNCQPQQGRMLFNSTGDDAVVLAGVKGAVIRRMPIPKLDPAKIINPGVPGDFARAGFARGLCVDEPSGTVTAGHSPGSVTAFDLSTGRAVRTVTVTGDIRNAPHGLAVWPFDR